MGGGERNGETPTKIKQLQVIFQGYWHTPEKSFILFIIYTPN